MARSRHARGGGCYDKVIDKKTGKVLYYRWRIGFVDPITGKKHFKTIKAKTAALRDEKVETWKQEHGTGEIVAANKWLVKDWVEKWLELSEARCEKTTLEHYCRIAKKHILPLFGNQKLGKVSSIDLQLYFDGLLVDHKPSGVNEIRSIFRICFGMAENHGILERNPVKRTRPPKYEKPKLKILNVQDIDSILEMAKSGEYLKCTKSDAREYLQLRNYLIVLFGAAAGMRLGEILGLMWSCVHRNEVEVNHSLRDMSQARELKSTKTKKARIVAIPVALAEKIEEWREYQSWYSKKYIGIFTNAQGLIFTGLEGRPVVGRHFTTYDFGMICRAAKVQKPRFHDLRHFAASFALMNHIPVAAVSAQLGHQDISTTLNIYTHVLQESRDEYHKMLDNTPLFF